MRKIVEEGTGTLETWPLAPAEDVLLALLRELFEHHWQQLTFGPLIQGAAWEITSNTPPKSITYVDGYATIDFGELHFHLCIGPHRGDDYAPTPAGLATKRRTSRAEFFRRINIDDTPDTWGVRLFNGAGEQQITVLLPNPFVTRDHGFEDTPQWERLALWDHLRRQYLGIAPEARDRSGQRMRYP
jgi:hypothetical protein